MKISHHSVTSSVFELIRTVEFDVRLSDDLAWTWRIELLQDTERQDHFRCHVWETEMFRLTPSFPRDENDQPAHITDDTIMVERPVAHRQLNYPFEDIIAPDPRAALRIIMSDLERSLRIATGPASQS